uniref:Putative secreted protein n=1 Tax=Anopheles triannulatus TaxID=58253 RepID=A0A2M4B297_9DIPT
MILFLSFPSFSFLFVSFLSLSVQARRFSERFHVDLRFILFARLRLPPLFLQQATDHAAKRLGRDMLRNGAFGLSRIRFPVCWRLLLYLV